MIKINLLPEERRRSEVPVHKFLLAGTYLVAAVTILFWSYSLFMFKYTESKLADAQSQIGSLHVWQERYELNQVQNAEINKRNNIVQANMKGKALNMDNILEFINRLQKEPTINSVDLLETKLSKAGSASGSATAIDFSLKVNKSEVGKK